MKKKYITKTFLKNVKEYNIKILIKEDMYICIKHIFKIQEPFCLKNGFCLIGNDYYIVEVLCENENYTTRIFFNNEKEEILKYYDIVNKVGLDKEIMVPYYEDLYLDVVVKDSKIDILDEDELETAYNSEEITEEQYKLAKNTLKELIEKIKNNDTFKEVDIIKYLD